MEEKILRMKCSFCGKKIECPENMASASKHACFECFRGGKIRGKGKLHIDFPREDFEEFVLGMPKEGG